MSRWGFWFWKHEWMLAFFYATCWAYPSPYERRALRRLIRAAKLASGAPE